MLCFEYCIAEAYYSAVNTFALFSFSLLPVLDETRQCAYCLLPEPFIWIDGYDVEQQRTLTTQLFWFLFNPSSTSVRLSASCCPHQLWWPLLFGLSEAMGDPRPQVRSHALKTLAEILDTHGHIFSAQTWGLLFRGVVSPVFENAIMDQSPPLSSEWPGQEEDPRDVLAAAVAAADEEAAMERAAREVEEEERAARRAAV